MGFEPTCPLRDKTLSRRPRYDHFGTSPGSSVHVRAALDVRTLRMSRAPSRFSGASAPFACPAAHQAGTVSKATCNESECGIEKFSFSKPMTRPAVLHEDDFLASFLADVLTRSFREPDGQRLALSVVEHSYFGHT